VIISHSIDSINLLVSIFDFLIYSFIFVIAHSVIAYVSILFSQIPLLYPFQVPISPDPSPPLSSFLLSLFVIHPKPDIPPKDVLFIPDICCSPQCPPSIPIIPVYQNLLIWVS